MAKKPKYQNALWDIYDFLQALRKEIGYNVTISLIQQDSNLTMGFHCQTIPHMQDEKPYEVHFEIPKDFKEPTANMVRVISDHVKAYIKSGGTATNVEIEGAKA